MPTDPKTGAYDMSPARMRTKASGMKPLPAALPQADGESPQDEAAEAQGGGRIIMLTEQPDGGWQVMCEGGEGAEQGQEAGAMDQPQTFTDPKELFAYLQQEIGGGEPGAEALPTAPPQVAAPGGLGDDLYGK